MSRKSKYPAVVRLFAQAFIFILACEFEGGALDLAESIKEISLPPNFKIDIYARDIPGARSIARGENGTVFVGTRNQGNVYALVDTNGDNKADATYTIARNLASPNGVAFRKGSLFVAEISRILRFDNIEASVKNPPKPVVVIDTLPRDTWHGWKYIKFGPDELLYVPVGAPCNVCAPPKPIYSTILRMSPDGRGGLSIYAEGIRNTVGFDWNPANGELWFTDNGRDYLGDDKPPDELNRAPKAGLHFGFPYVHGKGIVDPEFGKGKKPESYVPPEIELGPHVAALGMTFYTGTMFPAEYKNNIFIAEHGSWNRSKPIGYRVMLVTLRDGKAADYRVFASGWLEGSSAWGRPVDVFVMPDGSLLVSDDRVGAIYRISYSAK